MKRVELKQKSPEFIDLTKVKASTRLCDIDGCREAGEYRAPKNRSLNDYYKFCYAHVSDYNRAWNFFDGMSDADVQNSMYSSLFGDRPTWRYTSFGDLEEKLRNNAYGFRDHMEAEREKKEQERARAAVAPNTPEGEAMAIMELLPPVTLEGIKARYKELAKQFHPDRNPDNPEAEEKLKDINMAYTVLRLAYQKYENMAEK